MKFLVFLMFLVGCGTEHRDHRQADAIKWKSVAQIHIKAVVLSDPYALAQTENITYVSAQVNNFSIDAGSLGPVSEINGDLDLGSLDINNLVINNLDQCGLGTDRCTSARVALYTTGLLGYESIEGFVNTDDSYGVPVIVTATTGGLSGTVGLTAASAFGIETIDISDTSIRRINAQDFVNGPYLISSDFSNAGIGSYEMDLVVDLQLGD